MAKQKKSFIVMCRDYFKMGIAFLVVGMAFMFTTIVTNFNMAKIAVVSFFLILGTIDLVLYAFFRER